MTERDVQATERGCPACGHDMANHYEDANVRWCANCERPCEGTADEYDAAWREAWAVHRAAEYLDVPMGQVVNAIRAANDAFHPLPQSLELPTLGNLARKYSP